MIQLQTHLYQFIIYAHIIVYTYRQAFKNIKSLFLPPASPKTLKSIRRGAGWGDDLVRKALASQP